MSDNPQETSSSSASSNGLGVQPNDIFPFLEGADTPLEQKQTLADYEAVQEDKRLPMI